MERDYGKKNGEKHAGEKKGEGEYLSLLPLTSAHLRSAAMGWVEVRSIQLFTGAD